jgi:hypothetical protein
MVEQRRFENADGFEGSKRGGKHINLATCQKFSRPWLLLGRDNPTIGPKADIDLCRSNFSEWAGA